MRLTKTAIEELIVESGAEQRGHFVLASGLHSDRYLDKDALTANTQVMDLLCGEIARHFQDYPPEVVVGPAYGALVGAYVVAQIMNQNRARHNQVVPVFAVRDGSGLHIRKSMRRYVRGRRCLVIEDILTTGGSAKETVQATLEAGAESVIGVAAICNRGKVTKHDVGLTDDGEFFSLLELEGFATYQADECPMCRAEIEISREYGRGSVAA